MAVRRLSYILVQVLLLLDTCIAVVSINSGDGSGNDPGQVDQYCHNCKDEDFSFCEDKSTLMSEGGKERSECVDVCKSSTECLGVHYHYNDRYCTYLIECTVLYMTSENENGYLYRKSYNQDCPNFNLSLSEGLRIQCQDSLLTKMKSDVDIWDCVLECADTDGCRAVTHEEDEGPLCYLHFCATYGTLAAKRSTSFFKYCFTPVETTTTTSTTAITAGSVTSAQELTSDTSRSQRITISVKTATKIKDTWSHELFTGAMDSDVSTQNTTATASPRTQPKDITSIIGGCSTMKNEAIRFEINVSLMAHYSVFIILLDL